MATCKTFVNVILSLLIISFFQMTPVTGAQNISKIEGTVKTENGYPLRGVNVYIKGTNTGSVTNREGYYLIQNVPAGRRFLKAEYIGRESQSWTVDVKSGKTIRKDFVLSIKPFMIPAVLVTANQTAESTEFLSVLSPTTIHKKQARVTGELIRQVPGVDAVRRGPVGLDPVVRGLRETEVGTYIDGSRMFPAGPLRMDSPLSHIDPNSIQKIHVVKGPYALTLGAGNLSAISVETTNRPLLTEKLFSATVTSGFQSNLNAADVSASIAGRHNKLSYQASGTWREGDDYKAGNSQTIQADFKSREVRGKAGIALTPNSHLSITGGYQKQDNLDYPGRLLNADFFKTSNVSARYRVEHANGLLRSLNISGYFNHIRHRMDNDNKPTAVAGTFSNGKPRPPLSIIVNSKIQVVGGRVAANLATRKDWKIEVGSDVYSANRDATRTLSRRDNGKLLFTDLMWPDATITDVGLFSRVSKRFARNVKLSGSVRLDYVDAGADTASDFYLQNVSSNLDHTETHVSGAFTVSKLLSEHWLVSLGTGSVVRTADATERYSDRIPASKAQTTAEFVGNPALKPERSTQIDLWLTANYPRFSLNVNGFVRKINDYITLQPTDLPKRLPLSPETVFQYVNGDATFRGFEASALYRITPQFSLKTGMNYLWGKDDTLDEPALGITPFGVDTGFRFDSKNKKLYFEGTLHAVAHQNRVASRRGETPTNGYVTADLTGGLQLWQRMELTAGVLNLTDRNYINHLNAKNPFTGKQLPEPGRVFFTNLGYSF